MEQVQPANVALEPHEEADGFSCCSAHIAQMCLDHTPSHRSTQLCVMGIGLNLDGVVAAIVHEELQRHGPDHVFAVVLPDKSSKRLVSSFAASVKYLLYRLGAAAGDGNAASDSPPKRQSPSLPVHVVKEGTSTKERCNAFFAGGLVVTTAKTLCADLLHHRLAPEVIAVCLVCFPSVGLARVVGLCSQAAAGMGTSLTNLAFCVEIMLRGCGGATSRVPWEGHNEETDASNVRGAHNSSMRESIIPKITFLSDSPLWMQYLVSRHTLGRERFTSLLHVGDIQLFPRFRLSIVKHFEDLAKTKPLVVDRTLVKVSNDASMLDDLLVKVLRESLSGLQSQERRLSLSSLPLSTPATSVCDAVDDADADLRRLQPRVRARFESNPDGTTRRIEYEGKYRRPARADATGQDRIRPGCYSWRDPGDPAHVVFAGISEEDALETQTAGLDTDLAVALQANGPQWVFKERVESLLDVRRLRRALRFGSQYDFIFTLQHVLEKRTPRQRAGELGPPPPAAPWTLSAHFGDIVTIATHRIGRIEELPTTKTAPAGPPSATTATFSPSARTTFSTKPATEGSPGSSREGPDAVIDVDDDDESDDNEVPPPSTKALVLVPNEEEQDNHLHLTHRLTMSWLRDQQRRLSKWTAAGGDGSPSCAPVLLLLVSGPREVQGMMRRLRYTAQECRRRQLADFLALYQQHYGVTVVRRSGCLDSDGGDTADALNEANQLRLRKSDTPAGAGPAAAAGHQDTSSSDSGGDASDAETDRGEFFDAEAILEARAGLGDEGGTRQRGRDPAVDPEVGSGLALHQILLTQTTTVSPAELLAGPSAKTAPSPAEPPPLDGPLQLVYNSSSVALLGVPEDPSSKSNSQLRHSSLSLPRVAIADVNSLRLGDLLAMVRGDYALFESVAAASVRDGDKSTVPDGHDEVPATAQSNLSTPPCCLMVRRIILTRHSVPLLRSIEALQDELPASLLKSLKVQLVTTTFSESEGQAMIEKEKAAFQYLANAKATLTGRMLMDRSSVRRTEEMLEAGLAVHGRSAAGAGVGWGLGGRPGTGRWKKYANIAGQYVGVIEAKKPEAPLVVFDEREFRSMLPFYLYLHGIELVPLTLNTADYVLSPQYGLERKSVRDLIQSITGAGRIQEQLTALGRRYEKPLLLIEFDRGQPFRLVPANAARNTAGAARFGGAAVLYHRLARLVAAHPRVSLLWARSPPHAAGMIATLKLTVAGQNPDPGDGTLTGGLYAGGGADADDGPESEAAKATRHYAMRVLARFPGVNSRNADTVMRLCGSLAGLAEITKDSLVRAVGEDDGEKLYEFLHRPLAASRAA